MYPLRIYLYARLSAWAVPCVCLFAHAWMYVCTQLDDMDMQACMYVSM